MMNANKKNKTAYWIFTLLSMVPLLASGIGFCAAPIRVVQEMTQLGYPFYLIRFLGVAKALGAVTILIGRFPRLKEWAYAGFVFNLAGAAYSHLQSGDGPKTLVPLVILVLVLLSYFSWNQLGERTKRSGTAEEPGSGNNCDDHSSVPANTTAPIIP